MAASQKMLTTSAARKSAPVPQYTELVMAAPRKMLATKAARKSAPVLHAVMAAPRKMLATKAARKSAPVLHAVMAAPPLPPPKMLATKAARKYTPVPHAVEKQVSPQKALSKMAAPMEQAIDVMDEELYDYMDDDMGFSLFSDGEPEGPVVGQHSTSRDRDRDRDRSRERRRSRSREPEGPVVGQHSTSRDRDRDRDRSRERRRSRSREPEGPVVRQRSTSRDRDRDRTRERRRSRSRERSAERAKPISKKSHGGPAVEAETTALRTSASSSRGGRGGGRGRSGAAVASDFISPGVSEEECARQAVGAHLKCLAEPVVLTTSALTRETKEMSLTQRSKSGATISMRENELKAAAPRRRMGFSAVAGPRMRRSAFSAELAEVTAAAAAPPPPPPRPPPPRPPSPMPLTQQVKSRALMSVREIEPKAGRAQHQERNAIRSTRILGMRTNLCDVGAIAQETAAPPPSSPPRTARLEAYPEAYAHCSYTPPPCPPPPSMRVARFRLPRLGKASASFMSTAVLFQELPGMVALHSNSYDSPSRWEAVDDFLLRKQALAEGERRAEGWRKMPDYEGGLGVVVPVCRTIRELGDWEAMIKCNQESLLYMLKVAGHCDLNDMELSLLGVNVSECIDVLHASGLKSYGLTAANELKQLVATLLVLLALLWIQGKGGQGSVTDSQGALHLLKNLLQGREDSSLPSDLRLAEDAVQWCRATNNKYPLSCPSLELAPDWPTFCAKVLGLV